MHSTNNGTTRTGHGRHARRGCLLNGVTNLPVISGQATGGFRHVKCDSSRVAGTLRVASTVFGNTGSNSPHVIRVCLQMVNRSVTRPMTGRGGLLSTVLGDAGRSVSTSSVSRLRRRTRSSTSIIR